MGINAYDLRLLIKLTEKGLVRGPCAVMEIGAQQLDDDFLCSRAELETMGRLSGVAEPCPLPLPPAAPPDTGRRQPLDASAPSARQFWTWLGFDYAAIDIDGSPGSIPLDLNYDNVRAGLKGKFKLVTNYGTTEHVANQLNAFKIIHNLTAPGGIMIHNLPAQGMFNHGLINYNPKFFWMLSRSNGYRWHHMDLSCPSTQFGLPANIVDMASKFSPGFAEQARSYSAADCGIVVVMQKIHNIAFVPPLDVSTGTQTENAALKKRYWTVFKPEMFDEMEERARKGRRARLLDALKGLVRPFRHGRPTTDRMGLSQDDLLSSVAETAEPESRVDSKRGKS